MNEMQLEQLWIYPVKSLAGICLQRREVVERGLFMDRHWMLVDAKTGAFITQRKLPQMALMAVELTAAGIKIKGLDERIVQVSLDQTDGRTKAIQIWQDSFMAECVSEALDRWFSQQLKHPVILVRMPTGYRRQVDQAYAQAQDHTGFADGFPLLLIGTASLTDLNQRLPQDQKMVMANFRPNLVVQTQAPFIEDQWQEIGIGEMSFRLVKPCSRCSITTINPKTGQIGEEPLKTLSTYRRQGKQVMFGQNVIHNQTGLLKTGVAVRVVR